MQQGEPSVVALRTPMGVTIVTWMMAKGEEKIVAQRLKEVLTKARGTAHLRPQRTESELAALRQDNPIDEWDPDNSGLIPTYHGANE